jgi:hypothetical protein
VFDVRPFDRWTVRVLHGAFGDSSVGECFRDSTSVLAGAQTVW